MSQISPFTAGQARRGRRFPQILQTRTCRFSKTLLSNEGMQRLDFYIKVQVELEEDENPEKVASELCRQLEKIYVVRSAEVSSTIARE
jgi:hypothetical protein